MKITIEKKIAVDVTLESIDIHLKVCDGFEARFVDDEDRTILDYEGYVPSFFPGNHHGDYLILKINPETGHIMNWDANKEDIADFIEEKSGQD